MKTVTFDIETGPLPDKEIERIAPAFDESKVKVGNLGLEKQLEKIANARRGHLDAIVEKAALCAEYGETLAIGIMDDEGFEVLTGPEREIIPKFWSRVVTEVLAGPVRFCGHNIISFDLPFLYRRSLVVGCRIPSRAAPKPGGRYWPDFYFDTLEVWKAGNYRDSISLDRFCKSCGLDAKNGSGKFFSELFREDRDAALEYLRNDLEISHGLAKRVFACID